LFYGVEFHQQLSGLSTLIAAVLHLTASKVSIV